MNDRCPRCGIRINLSDVAGGEYGGSLGVEGTDFDAEGAAGGDRGSNGCVTDGATKDWLEIARS